MFFDDPYQSNALPGICPAIRFGPNRERRTEARQFLKDIEKELGPLSVKERLQCWGSVPLSLWTWMAEKPGIFQQPRLLRIEHRR